MAKHDSKWLKLWYKRLNGALEESKKEGYSEDFERFWKLYDSRTGSKSEAYAVWNQKVSDPEAVIAAVRPYKADCKKEDISVAHARTWLNQRRWESYEGVEAVAKKKKVCDICKTGDALYNISYKMDGKSYGAKVCVCCRVHDHETYNKDTKEWT